MGTAAIRANTAVRIDGKKFVILRKVSDVLWQLEEVKSKRIHEKTDRELRSLYESGNLEFEGDGDDKVRELPGKRHLHVPESQFEKAKVRRAYAVAAMGVPATEEAIRRSADAVWAQLKQPEKVPHWTTVFRWRSKFVKASQDIHSVVAQFGKRGNRKPRYPQEVREIVEREIEAIYLKPEKKSMQDVLDQAILEVRRENNLRPAASALPEPTRRLVSTMIDQIPAFDRCLAREGRTVAMRKFRSVLGHRTTEAPLERAEIDHTQLDLMVIDERSGLPLGRPWLTVCIDDYTRCVLGINIGFEPPSFLTVARCLKHAFLPKVNVREQYPEVLNGWDAHGVMRELSMDNGSEFHSRSLEEACYSLGIEIHYSPRKTPWFKGKVERFQGTANAQVARIAPGTTFANIFEKDEYDPAKHAVVRLGALLHIVHIWVVDVYHQRPHRTLQAPPAHMWKSSIASEDILLPEDPARLDAILGRREDRVLSHKGVELNGLFYNSPEMTALRMQLGEKLDVELCIDDGDIGKLVVLSPDKKRMFVVPALAQGYASGMTAWQHKVCKRYAAKEMGKHDSTAWLEAKERIAKMIDSEFALKNAKGKTRARAARYVQGGGSFPAVAATAPPEHGASPPPSAQPASQAPPHAKTKRDTPATPDRLTAVAPARRFAAVVRERAATHQQVPNQ